MVKPKYKVGQRVYHMDGDKVRQVKVVKIITTTQEVKGKEKSCTTYMVREPGKYSCNFNVSTNTIEADFDKAHKRMRNSKKRKIKASITKSERSIKRNEKMLAELEKRLEEINKGKK